MRDPMPVGEERQMDQPTFADLKYQGKKRKTRWELFLVLQRRFPWRGDSCEVIGPATASLRSFHDR